MSLTRGAGTWNLFAKFVRGDAKRLEKFFAQNLAGVNGPLR
jgi:hypothetical protein